nr:hypothetical protein CFP56_07470 [Quercus suber]
MHRAATATLENVIGDHGLPGDRHPRCEWSTASSALRQNDGSVLKYARVPDLLRSYGMLAAPHKTSHAILAAAHSTSVSSGVRLATRRARLHQQKRQAQVYRRFASGGWAGIASWPAWGSVDRRTTATNSQSTLKRREPTIAC